ncbi:MAG: argininosuccinate lyase, partial [Firmicutes bacterium]|nr:argininosuccinate lyase [Bacillota bacterium]
AEDIHTFVEAELTRRAGEAGKRLHTGRSRNDQVATDLRLYLREQCGDIVGLLKGFIGVLHEQGAKNPGAVMPGYTHLQRAQPVLFAQHMLAYEEMFTRDIGRIEDAARRMNVCPLGSGALAGTGYPIDRAFTAEKLGFDGFTKSTLDGVADRDFCAELAAALSLVMVHLSRLSEELILWCSWEFRFAELDDAYTTGSSIMPQKKNPDLAELIRGKSGRVFGDLQALLVMLKGLPLAYNKDMQEDKEAIFDAFDTVRACLEAAAPMVATMRALPENMRAAAAGGFINATDCADYLVGKGMPFRDAYRVVGALVAACIEGGFTLETLPLERYQAACGLFGEDIYAFVALEACVARRQK